MIPPYMSKKLEAHYEKNGDFEAATKQKQSNDFVEKIKKQNVRIAKESKNVINKDNES